jgi:hypothetical protein
VRYLEELAAAIPSKRTGAKPQQRERKLQTRILVSLAQVYPHVFVAAIPNGGSRGKLEAVNLKRSGVKRGVPDLFMIGTNGKTAFLEVKEGKGKPTDEQLAFGSMCHARGVQWGIAYDVEYALDFVARLEHPE